MKLDLFKHRFYKKSFQTYSTSATEWPLIFTQWEGNVSYSHQNLNNLMLGEKGWTIFRLARGGDSYMMCQLKKDWYPFLMKESMDNGGKNECLFSKKLVSQLITQVHTTDVLLFIWACSERPHENFNIRERCVFLSCHECGTKKNSDSPWGIEPQTFRFPRSDALTTEPQRLHGEWGLLQSSYDMRPAYC